MHTHTAANTVIALGLFLLAAIGLVTALDVTPADAIVGTTQSNFDVLDTIDDLDAGVLGDDDSDFDRRDPSQGSDLHDR